MFNITTVQNPTQFVDRHIETHEHRAPTDESVKLLREMEKAVARKTISVHRLTNNTIDAVWHLRDDPMGLELTGHCRFILNGKPIEFELPLERHYRNDDHARTIITAIIDRIAKEIATKLLIEGGYQSRLLR